MHARWTLTGLVALAIAAGGPPALKAAGPTVTVEDLGPADVSTFARGVNVAGLAAGFGADSSGHFGFTQMAAPLQVPLPLGATSLDALAVNDAGLVVGGYHDSGGALRGFRYDTATNAFTDVPYLTNATAAQAQAVNATGVVAGYQLAGATRGFRQSPGLAPEDIGDLGGGTSVAYGINASGTVVGYSYDKTAFRAIRFDGALHTLATLGGPVSVANAINDTGLIVGYSYTAANAQHAAAWTSDATVLDLGTLGGASSQAFAVSPSGTVVGTSRTVTNVSHACMWQGATLTDLNDLIDPASGWVLESAYGVNDHGVVVGDGHLNGVARAFRLTMASEDDADLTPPTMGGLHASPDTLWPPNNQMVPVTVSVQSSDDSGNAPTCQIAGITATESHAGDMLVTGPMTASLRAAKSTGGERVYTLSVQCTDAAGNVASDSTTVRVPKSASSK